VSTTPDPPNRRRFLQSTAALAALPWLRRPAAGAPAAEAQAPAPAGGQPWFRRARRWMQTNIAEIDPRRYDIRWWREEWRRTATEGIIVNAGGIVAYYPTRIPFHQPAEFLDGRDLFGDIRDAARADGIVVLARMDSNGGHDALVEAHPDWFARNARGGTYPRDATLHVPCVNGPYYREQIPAILREIATRYHPEGFTDNSWSGLSRSSICYCDNCRAAFRRARGLDLPSRHDWNDSTYRAWIDWNYECRVAIWDLFNQTTRDAGGAECHWIGMMNGSVSGASSAFRDYRAIARRSGMVLLDNQHRSDATGFQANGQTGKLVHGLAGWDVLAPESYATYQTGSATFRLAARPEPELRLWAIEGAAGGIQPWWHFVNAYHEDRRAYPAPVAFSQWHRAHEGVLFDRTPIATVGVVYSQRNQDFFGRDDARGLVDLPSRGITEALTHARIPYVLVHADDLAEASKELRALVLPNVGVMTDEQVAAVRAFVARGGGLVATGATSLCDAFGDARSTFALGDLFGVRLPADHPLRAEDERRRQAAASTQTYLRLTPELRAGVDGPHIAGEPPAGGPRHPILAGFDATDIVPFGGTLAPMAVAPDATVLLTFVPPRPAFPPESVWLLDDRTDIPGLVVRDPAGGGRVAYFPADLDARFARDHFGDSRQILVKAIRWVAHDDMPLVVEGPGLVDCHLYRQEGRAILHVINLTNEGTWRSPIDEIIPVGPLRIRVRLPPGVRGRRARLLVSAASPSLRVADGWASVDLPAVTDHEVVVVEG
jgi:hypothetical protein